MFVMRELGADHMDVYIDVLIERCNWLQGRGLDMWKSESLTQAALIDRYGDPMCFAGFEDSACVGGFLLIDSDRRYWPRNLDDAAYYFHKFAVSPRFGGKGYSTRMLDWVKDFGKQNGKAYIRLDYQKHRRYLREMYLGAGFRDVEEIETAEGAAMILAEYEIGI
jgi:GNAT superfamily N-acetyltransferase